MQNITTTLKNHKQQQPKQTQIAHIQSTYSKPL